MELEERPFPITGALRDRKVNLFIVGAPKCGTTAWQQYLGDHRDIYISESKESCFFGLDLPRFRLIKTNEAYAAMFTGVAEEKIVGEASAMYLFSSRAAEAIRNYNPDAKILILLRRQETYLPALHNQFLWEFSEEIRDFSTVWELSGDRNPETIPFTCLEPRTLDYKAMGRFREQVERYFRAFAREQIFVAWYEDWIVDPRRTYVSLLEFLGVPDDGRTHFPQVNRGVTYRSRWIVRSLYYPPRPVRWVARLFKRLAGIDTPMANGIVEAVVRSLSSPGYRKRISSNLKQEIRDYYAEDNRLLAELLRTSHHHRPRLPSSDERHSS